MRSLKLISWLTAGLFISCNENVKSKVSSSIPDLKRGETISCGPEEGELFGTVSFTASIPKDLQSDFNKGIALLHSFEYDEAEKMFAKVIDRCADCAMAYWGVAMSNFHALWTPPTPEEIKKGKKAIEIAQSIKNKTEEESEYINAIGKFYLDAEQLDHRSRVQNFETAMEEIYSDNPKDIEAAIFYSLALNAAADPTDKTYTRQKKAIGILNALFEEYPLHPGIAHYIIHNADYPELATMGLPAARKYASIAPASAHAQHMPSHIFTRLGLWDECIQSNLVSVSSAKCYAEQAKINGHWDEELHGLDYLAYAYLQKGNDKKAQEQLDYLSTINAVFPVTFKTAYAFASIPARFYLERKMWDEAATMQLHPVNYPWEKFPWQKGIYHFGRLIGNININNSEQAKIELDSLQSLYNILSKQKDKAKEARNVLVQIKAGQAWLEFKKGNNEKALQLMKESANMEDGTEKHPVTPGEVYPARELLAEMLLQMNKPSEALEAFEAGLAIRPKRLNALYGAGIAAEKSGNKEKATQYFQELSKTIDPASTRKELLYARSFASN